MAEVSPIEGTSGLILRSTVVTPVMRTSGLPSHRRLVATHLNCHCDSQVGHKDANGCRASDSLTTNHHHDDDQQTIIRTPQSPPGSSHRVPAHHIHLHTTMVMPAPKARLSTPEPPSSEDGFTVVLPPHQQCSHRRGMSTEGEHNPLIDPALLGIALCGEDLAMAAGPSNSAI